MNEVVLTPEQKRQWTETMNLLGWVAPGFRHIFYRMLTQAHGEHSAIFTNEVPTAATDGYNMLVNPEWYFKRSLMERVFIAAHEIAHNFFEDVELLHRCAASGKVPMINGSTLPFEEDVMEVAADYRINALLVDSKIGKMPKSVDENGKETQIGCYNVKIATANDSIYDVYAKVYKQKKASGGKLGVKGFDKLLEPGKSMGKQAASAAAARNGQQWAIEIAIARDLQERAQGGCPGALSRMFEDLLEPKVPWTEHIRTIFARKLGADMYDWRRPDRRFIVQDIHLPSRRGASAGWIAIWADTSGSISQADFRTYLGEFSGIIDEVNPRRLTVYWCDCDLHQTDELAEPGELAELQVRGVKGGGGGTSMLPVLDAIAQEQDAPECFIGFTDGDVKFPNVPPDYPFVWASVSDHTYPFGDVVRIK